MSTTFEIRKQVVLPAPPAQVWRAVATAEGQAAWSPDPGAEHSPGMTVEAEELKRLTVRTPTAEDGAFHEFVYVLIPGEEGETTLDFVHRGDLGSVWEGDHDYAVVTSRGWDMYLHTLTQYLAYFPGRPATFVTAQAPASGMSDDAWPRLLAALGLARAPTVGEQVRLEPNGPGPIDGVVDRAEPDGSLLAVRTADGLYRFHDLSAIGMPIAVGHYIYEDDAEQNALTAVWEAWLQQTFAE